MFISEDHHPQAKLRGFHKKCMEPSTTLIFPFQIWVIDASKTYENRIIFFYKFTKDTESITIKLNFPEIYLSKWVWCNLGS